MSVSLQLVLVLASTIYLLPVSQSQAEGSESVHSYFTVRPDVLENIRLIINRGNTETVQSVAPEIMEEIRKIFEIEIQKFRFLGKKPEYAVKSCKDVGELQPCSPSGYYWLDTPDCPLGVWCEMNPEVFNQTGGWMKVTSVDMRNNATQCPRGLATVQQGPKRLCQRTAPTAGCTSTFFDVHGLNYSTVCGRITGYQYYSTEGFYASSAQKRGRYRTFPAIDAAYVDGVSITYGSPRKHIWTLAAAKDEISQDDTVCTCTNTETDITVHIPDYVEENYYCDTGSRVAASAKFYLHDPLWDGQGCGESNECCGSHNGWFCKKFSEITNSRIEVCVCTNEARSNEDILLETIQLYVQ